MTPEQQLIQGLDVILHNGDCSEENNMDKIRYLYLQYVLAKRKEEAALAEQEGGTNQ